MMNEMETMIRDSWNELLESADADKQWWDDVPWYYSIGFLGGSVMERLIRKVWNELSESVDKQEFDPKNEEEMRICVCYFLIRHLIERFGTAKGLHVPKHPHENKQTDIRYKDQLYVENKHILRSGIRTDERWELRRNLAEADIKKLQAIKKRQPDATCVFTVFAPTYKAEDDQDYYNDVRDWCQKAGVIFLTLGKHAFRGEKWRKRAENRIVERKIRLAYVLGSLRTLYEIDSEKKGVGGDVAMFAIPPEVHAEIINDKPSGDVYRLRNVTPEDVTSILKCVYGEDFESLAAQGLELRKKGAQGSGISSK